MQDRPERGEPARMSFLRTYLRTLGALRGDAGVAILLAIANIALAGAQFAEPVLFGRIIDRLTSHDAGARAASWGDILPLGAAWAGFGLFVIGCSVIVALHADRLSHRNRLNVMAKFFDHVLHLPLSSHSAVHSGRLLKIMLEGANGMAGLWLSFFRDHCAALVSLLVMLPLSMVLNWRLGGLLVLLVALFGLFTILVLRRTEGMQGRVEQYQTAFAERAADALGNVPVIQSFARIESETVAMRALIDRLLRVQLPVLSWWALAAVATRASATCTILALFALGISLHFRGLATVGQVVAFMSFATLMIARLDQAVAFANALFLQAPKLRDFFGILDTAPTVRDRPGARDPGRLAGRVAFEGVSFSYDGRRDAVTGLTFAAAPGETIALVGATGSGKTTTLGLLHRVFDPAQGRITIDGLDLRDMTIAALRRNIGVVFQEPMLFARSIEENLRIGAPDATVAEIATALDKAQAADFVARQPDGLAAIIGERGRSLSGGERQRLAIARALLKDPPILIFDEATSALDPATERKVQRALQAATLARTTFIIAHRLTTIRHADRILVFDGGRIVESGSWDELVGAGGRFAALVAA
jgi:ATP-binding cassette subfamily B protein